MEIVAVAGGAPARAEVTTSDPKVPPVSGPSPGMQAKREDEDLAMELDRNGLEELERDECLRLLGQRHVGRVGVTVRALPVVLPVNFAVLGDDVVFRTDRGAKLDAALHHAVVAFEVDSFDTFDHTGWSVLVTGVADPITDPGELEAARRLPLRPWAGGNPDNYVKIRSQLVTGRRVRPGVGISE
jgi:hypothetical protein